jgi:hypothetical protein
MANRFWVNGGTGNWNSTTNWSATSGGSSGASVPGTADDVYFNGSGNSNCTINVNTGNEVRSLNFDSGYTATVTAQNLRRVYANTAIVLQSNTILVGTTGGIGLNGIGSTLRTNGCNIGCRFEFMQSTSISLLDVMNISGEVYFQAPVGNMTINGFSIEASGNITLFNNATSNRTTQGTTILNIVGSADQTLSYTTARMGLTSNINKTGGTLTISQMIMQGTLNYLAGTVSAVGQLIIEGNSTLNTSGISWGNVRFDAGDITLASAITITGNLSFIGGGGSGTINIFGVGFLTSIGGSLINTGVNATVNLANNLTCNGISVTNQTLTINTHTITNTGNLTLQGNLTGTGTVIMTTTTTATWSSPTGSGIMSMNLTFNSAGTINITGNVVFGATGRSLIRTNGNIVVATNGQLQLIGSLTLDTNTINWENILVNTSGTNTLTLLSTFTVNKDYIIGSNTNTTSAIAGTAGFFTNIGQDLRLTGSNSSLVPNNPINIARDLVAQNAAGVANNSVHVFSVNRNLTIGGNLTGTGTVHLIGTGSWTSTGGYVMNNLVINTAGTITLGATVRFGNAATIPTLTLTSGVVDAVTNNNTFEIQTCILNAAGINFNNVSRPGTVSNTITLQADWNILGNYVFPNVVNSGTVITTNGLYNVNIGGNLQLSTQPLHTLVGTATYRMVGTGTLSASYSSGAAGITNTFVIDTLGTIIFSGTIHFYNNPTFTFTKGTINPSTSRVIFGGTMNVNDNGLNFNILEIDANTTFAGTNGWSTNQLISATGTHIYQIGNTYTVNSLLQLLGTAASRIVMRSSTLGTRSNFILTYGATQTVAYVNPKDIDSSGGDRVWDWQGVLDNTINWGVLVAPTKRYKTFV